MKPEEKVEQAGMEPEDIGSEKDEQLADGRTEADDEEPNVTPEEQKQYDTVVGKAMELLYADERLPVLVKKLRDGADNISAEIGHSAAMTLTTIARTVENQGQEIPEEILYSAGQEIVSQVTDIAEAAGIISPEQSQAVAEAALYEGLRLWGEMMTRDGKLTDERQMEAQDALKQAGIEQKAPAGKQPPAGAGQPPQAGPRQPQQPPPAGGIVNQAAGAA